jgi:hypothetical protein
VQKFRKTFLKIRESDAEAFLELVDDEFSKPFVVWWYHIAKLEI